MLKNITTNLMGRITDIEDVELKDLEFFFNWMKILKNESNLV